MRRLLGLDEAAAAAARREAEQRLRSGEGARATKVLAKAYARERGMVVQTGVTKETDLLVAADPDSQSGKAKKARAYGIRIVAEPAFWRMMGARSG